MIAPWLALAVVAVAPAPDEAEVPESVPVDHDRDGAELRMSFGYHGTQYARLVSEAFGPVLKWDGGVELSLGVRFVSGIYLGLGYVGFFRELESHPLPLYVSATESIEFQVFTRRNPIQLLFGYEKRWRYVGLGGELRLNVDVQSTRVFIDPEVLEDNVHDLDYLQESVVDVGASVSVGPRLSVYLDPRVSLYVAPMLDVSLRDPPFVLLLDDQRDDPPTQRESTLFVPSRVRPALAAGVTGFF